MIDGARDGVGRDDRSASGADHALLRAVDAIDGPLKDALAEALRHRLLEARAEELQGLPLRRVVLQRERFARREMRDRSLRGRIGLAVDARVDARRHLEEPACLRVAARDRLQRRHVERTGERRRARRDLLRHGALRVARLRTGRVTGPRSVRCGRGVSPRRCIPRRVTRRRIARRVGPVARSVLRLHGGGRALTARGQTACRREQRQAYSAAHSRAHHRRSLLCPTFVRRRSADGIRVISPQPAPRGRAGRKLVATRGLLLRGWT